MAEFLKNEVQLVALNSPVILRLLSLAIKAVFITKMKQGFLFSEVLPITVLQGIR